MKSINEWLEFNETKKKIIQSKVIKNWTDEREALFILILFSMEREKLYSISFSSIRKLFASNLSNWMEREKKKCENVFYFLGFVDFVLVITVDILLERVKMIMKKIIMFLSKSYRFVFWLISIFNIYFVLILQTT